MTTATLVRDTSLSAYDGLKSDGRAGAQEQRVLDAMQHGRDYSLQELARATGMPINAVSGRVNGLKKKGLVVEAPRRACSVTGNTIHPVRLPSLDGQGSLFQ